MVFVINSYLSILVIKLKIYGKALDDLREVIESDPRNVKAHFRRGSCFKAISMYCLVSILSYLIKLFISYRYLVLYFFMTGIKII